MKENILCWFTKNVLHRAWAALLCSSGKNIFRPKIEMLTFLRTEADPLHIGFRFVSFVHQSFVPFLKRCGACFCQRHLLFSVPQTLIRFIPWNNRSRRVAKSELTCACMKLQETRCVDVLSVLLLCVEQRASFCKSSVLLSASDPKVRCDYSPHEK